jgi:hypothetical protein
MQGIDWRSNTRLDQNTNNFKSANPIFPLLMERTMLLSMDGINMVMMHWRK